MEEENKSDPAFNFTQYCILLWRKEGSCCI